MPTRIANYASQQILNSYLTKVRNRIQDTQVQLTSEKRAQTYAGIGDDTQRLVGYEVDVQRLTNYKRDNDIQEVYMKSTETAMEGIEKVIKNFRTTLQSFNTTTPTDENSIRTIQEQAFRSMQSLQGYLNTEVNGRYLFAGNRTNSAPVNLGLSTLTAFQEKFDGVNLSYPTSRATHLEDFSITEDSAGRTDWLVFAQDNDGDTTTSGSCPAAEPRVRYRGVAPQAP